MQEGGKVIHASKVGTDGGFVSKTRTSDTGFVSRSRTPLLDAVHARFADVVGVSNSLWQRGLQRSDPRRGSDNGWAEELQVVRYAPGQQYLAHLDFTGGSREQRFLTLLLYVQTPTAGGHTSFPKAAGGRGIRVRPPRGGGILFYSMLPDGNGDELSLHAGEAVREGTKWACNLWLWDRGAGPSATASPAQDSQLPEPHSRAPLTPQ